MFQIISMKSATMPWRNTVFLDEDGEVYMPAEVFGDEFIMALCLIHDCKRQLAYEGHIYAPASWLAKEYPDLASKINEAAQRTRQYKPTSDDVLYVGTSNTPGPVTIESVK